ncbi:MAG: diadenylate cyclase CdaA, partial [Candidatus Binatia bacterium]
MQIGLADIIDIALVTIVLYMAVVWLRRTKAGLVGLGIFILGAVYIIARQLGLQLIAWFLQGFFAIFLIIIVVIFQEELRQIFERIALWSLRKKGTQTAQSETADTLVETVSDLARDRIGALIVLPGSQPIERHVSGGIKMDGELSEPLLKSIFDPHSAGHDGAVIIENNRITSFASHLPLSKDIQQLSKVGTRHSAALGLAELTDALCLVISEERGRISIAKDGRLREIQMIQELGSALNDFLKEKSPAQDPRKISMQLLRENWMEKAVSLCLAIGLWYVFIPGAKISEITYEVPVEVEHLPADFVLEKVEPPNVRVTFQASRRSFYLFEPKMLEATIDASLAALGRRTFRISEENIHHPNGLSVKQFGPKEVKIWLNKRPSKGLINKEGIKKAPKG